MLTVRQGTTTGGARRPREGQAASATSALREALEGPFESLHAPPARSSRTCTSATSRSSGSHAIEEQLRPSTAQSQALRLLGGIYGSAQTAEIGTDMTVFPQPATSPRGQANARATTSRPASAAPRPPATEMAQRRQDAGATYPTKTATSKPNTNDSDLNRARARRGQTLNPSSSRDTRTAPQPRATETSATTSSEKS